LHNALAEDFDPLELDNVVITELVGMFLAKHREHEQSVEHRVEQLECQVTDMSFDLIRTKSKCHAYEAGLKELLQVDDTNAMKDRVYQLQVIAGKTSYHFHRDIICKQTFAGIPYKYPRFCRKIYITRFVLDHSAGELCL